jgi:hypothetical protein
VRRGNERRCLLSDSRRMIFGPSEQRTPLHRRGSSRCRREASVEQLRPEGRRSRRSRRGCAIPSAAATPLLGISRRGALGRRTGQAATSAAGESPGEPQPKPFRQIRVILDAQPAGQPIGLPGWSSSEEALGRRSGGWGLRRRAAARLWLRRDGRRRQWSREG